LRQGGDMMNLNVSSVFFEIALLLLPGFVWMKIHTKYGAKGEVTQFDMILNAFLFGIIAYAVLYIIYWKFNIPMHVVSLDVDSKKLFQPEIFVDIFAATGFAIMLAILHLYGENYKLFTRFVQAIKATKTFGDEDVWDFVFNSSSASSVDYLHFRDFENQVVYAGYLNIYSKSGQLRELVLRDVIVYDFDGQEMYKAAHMYLARERDKIHIEFPVAN
jgi:hypothetical protein